MKCLSIVQISVDYFVEGMVYFNFVSVYVKLGEFEYVI